ncbi:MFS transporter [Peptoniphilus sp. AGMB00490]|uniref:MFS transporter n=1 Tax=Peptoniphilus faecalis TaxID=2731255 RepID=A0A848RJP2_9FIRM|nr:MFS transporter [Peptoniphilus faecalis]NMW85406.1 MFS transporter [Peptoniphilus faecalis]
MKINNFLIKISNKINNFFKKHFGRARGFNLIVLAIMSFFSAMFFYYYIEDFNVPRLLALLIFIALFFIIYTIAEILLKIIIILIKRIRAKNLALYAILIYGIKYFYDQCLYYVDLKHFEIIFTLGTFLTILAFSKSLISLTKNKKKKALLFLMPSTIIILASLYFMFFPGFDSGEIYEIKGEKNKIASEPEKYKVEVIDYEGKPVNLRDFVNYSGNTKKVRDKFFGKTLKETEVKGRIYAPKDLKRAPLLFVLHGNHRFTTKNYLGYDYLGHYLAQRGIAVVSVDENMLNGFLKFGLSNENDARAVLLLENIKNILTRNKREDSILYNRFDQENIALLGHSRGGEAAAIAYNFNQLHFHPDDGSISHKYNFNIKGIITVSPTYDQYEPSDKSIILKDVDYLTIGGSNDADVDGFEGMLLYDNVFFSGEKDKFKAAIYLGYGNHGNFNSLWGDYDIDPVEGFFLNRRELLDGDDQREILSIYTLNFLENVFEQSYNREIFREGPKDYGDLPKTNYYNRYMDSTFLKIADFEEDYDLTTTSIRGGIINFDNLKDIYEHSHEYGESKSNTTAVFLEGKEKSTYGIRFTEKIPTGKFLQFDIENLNLIENSESIDIEIQDTWGSSALLNLSKYKNITPMTKAFIYKTDYLTDDYLKRYSPQTVLIPMEDFKKQNSNIKLDEINKIEFQIKDNTKISIDNLGISN